MTPPPIRLLSEAAAAAAPILARHADATLPTWPYGTLMGLLKLHQDNIQRADILDGLTVVVALRHWLNWVEFRHLRRAAHAHYVIQVSQRDLVGDVLGISNSGITKRRGRLARTVAERGQVKNSPSLPRIDLRDAEKAAAALLDHRAGHVDASAPDSQDLLGVASYAAVWHDATTLDQLAQDIHCAQTIIVALRRHLDDVEADLLDLGRAHGMSNTELGKPLGRLGNRATWKARVRLRHGDRAGRARRIDAVPTEVPIITADPSSLDESVHAWARTTITNLLAYRPKINDDDLDVWLGWLAEHATKPLTDRALTLLWATADEITTSPHARKIKGLNELAEQILTFTGAAGA